MRYSTYGTCTLSGMWSEFKEVCFALSEQGLWEKGTAPLPQTAAGLAGGSWCFTEPTRLFPPFYMSSRPISFQKKKNPPKEALYTSAITYHVLIWEPSLLLVCSWEGQHLTAQNSHDHLTADSHKRSVNARCVQNSRLRVLENEILQGKEKHRDRAS